MGARPEDYARVAPPNSYIHVDDFSSPKELARYLLYLDQNATAYGEFFQWKGTGEFINTKFWCRLCAMLHQEGHSEDSVDVDAWWRGPGTCVQGRPWASWKFRRRHKGF